jgi:deoxycytidylate deaminase
LKKRTVRSKAKPPIHQHGAVIAVNGKVIAKGTNHDRSTRGGKFFSSTHAEIQAIENWKKLNKGKTKRALKKIAQRSEIYIVRKSRKTGGFCKSTPCVHCAKTIKEWKFKKIIYSNGEGSEGFKSVNTKKTEIKDITTHLSRAQKDAGKHIVRGKNS